MSPRILASALLLAAALAGGARAQTYDPAVTQQMLNQEQMNIQSQQLQQLQRQNNLALQQSNPALNAQATQAQVQLNLQAAELNATRMQALSADPAAVNNRLQANSAAIQQIRPPQPQP